MAVFDALEAPGVPTARIHVEVAGASDPLVDEAPHATSGVPANRRVRVLLRQQLPIELLAEPSP